MSYDESEAAAQSQLQSLWRSVDAKGGASGHAAPGTGSWLAATQEAAAGLGSGPPFWAAGALANASEKDRTAPFVGMYDGKKLGGSAKKKAPAGPSAGRGAAGKRGPQSDAKPGKSTPAAGRKPAPKTGAKNALDAARTAAGTKGGTEAKHAAKNAAMAGLGKNAAPGSKLAAAAPALQAAAQGARPADQLKKLDQPTTVSGWQALSIGRDLKAQAAGQSGTVGAANKQHGVGTDHHDLEPYKSPFASVFLTGITDETANAQSTGQYITGHSDSVALYDGTRPGTDQKSEHNTSPADLNSPDKKTRDQANASNNTDMAYDALAVTQFARMGDAVQFDKDGKLKIDEAALSQPVQVGGKEGEQYMSALQMGEKGADAAIKSNPELAKLMAGGGDPTTDPKLAGQFISITGHSGGGQSSFYSALELAQRGFKNVSVVGYDMAMTPHQREVLEKLGVNVTNITGHSGSKENYLNSPVGELIRSSMGGDQSYYDASVDRGGSEGALSAHNIVGNDRVTTMMRYATWLDSQGKHQEWNDANYAAFLKSTGGTGDNVKGPDGSLHNSASPISGSFVDKTQAKDPALYLQTPQFTGQDLLSGVGSVPVVGDWLQQKLGGLADQNLPGFRDTQMPRLDVAVNPQLQTQGSVNGQQLSAQGSVNMAGSSIDVLGAHLTAGDWAQASGSVNLSQGAGSVNVGGQGGVGADVNLSQGNLDLNVFGNKIDVDQGIRNAWGWLTGN
jgi:hypothetical protein